MAIGRYALFDRAVDTQSPRTMCEDESRGGKSSPSTVSHTVRTVKQLVLCLTDCPWFRATAFIIAINDWLYIVRARYLSGDMFHTYYLLSEIQLVVVRGQLTCVPPHSLPVSEDDRCLCKHAPW